MKDTNLHKNKKDKAQGTIEYLVIMAVVVIISLVGVAVVTGITPTDEITNTTEEVQTKIGVIALSSILFNPDGNYLIILKGNSADPVEVDSIVVDGETVDFLGINNNENKVYFSSINFSSDTKLFLGNEKAFRVPSTKNCVEGNKSTINVKINYLTKNGLPNTISYDGISVVCSVASFSGTIISPSGEVSQNPEEPEESEELNPVINLASPQDENNFIGTEVIFEYEVNDFNPTSCDLYIDDVLRASMTEAPFNSFNITLNRGERNWKVSCTNDTNTIESEERTVYVYGVETINSCRRYFDSSGAWTDYTKYNLTANLSSTYTGSGSGSGITSSGSGSVSQENLVDSFTTCFAIPPYNTNIILDCQNKIITGAGAYNGVQIELANNITIQNCEFRSFGSGIVNNGGNGIVLDQVTLVSNNVGYSSYSNSTGTTSVKDSVICNNTTSNANCYGHSGGIINIGGLTSQSTSCTFTPTQTC